MKFQLVCATLGNEGTYLGAEVMPRKAQKEVNVSKFSRNPDENLMRILRGFPEDHYPQSSRMFHEVPATILEDPATILEDPTMVLEVSATNTAQKIGFENL